MIRCTQAPLNLTNCRLTCRGNGAALVAREAGEVEVHGCEIDTDMAGLSIEIGEGRTTRIRITDTRLSVREASGAALSLWTAEPRSASPVELFLEGNTIQAGRVVSMRDLSSKLTVTAHGNHLLGVEGKPIFLTEQPSLR